MFRLYNLVAGHLTCLISWSSSLRTYSIAKIWSTICIWWYRYVMIYITGMLWYLSCYISWSSRICRIATIWLPQSIHDPLEHVAWTVWARCQWPGPMWTAGHLEGWDVLYNIIFCYIANILLYNRNLFEYIAFNLMLCNICYITYAT